MNKCYADQRTKAKPTYLVLFFKLITSLFFIAIWTWGVTAIFLNVSGPLWQQYIFASFFALLLPTQFLLSKTFLKGSLLSLCAFAVLLFWWQTLTPTADKDWAQDVAKISHGEIGGDTLTMYNVRNFDYQSEQQFTQNWETRTFDLKKLQGVDIFLSYWASDNIAHTILSWDFGEDGHLPISIETRKDKTQEYSAIKGFFKQFEICYIASDETDIIRLRTNYRKERVYLYRLQAPPERVVALLKDYLREMNSLVTTPEFYDALSHNCTTTIQIHANATIEDLPAPIDWRLIASGHVDELLYDRGVLTTDIPFADLRAASRVDLKMQDEGKDNFSRKMRDHIKTALNTNEKMY